MFDKLINVVWGALFSINKQPEAQNIDIYF